MILLTDDEIKGKWHTTIFEPGDNQVSYSLREVQEIAKAQLKKVVGWGIEQCRRHYKGGGVISKRECPECWKVLKKEL